MNTYDVRIDHLDSWTLPAEDEAPPQPFKGIHKGIYGHNVIAFVSGWHKFPWRKMVALRKTGNYCLKTETRIERVHTDTVGAEEPGIAVPCRHCNVSAPTRVTRRTRCNHSLWIYKNHDPISHSTFTTCMTGHRGPPQIHSRRVLSHPWSPERNL